MLSTDVKAFNFNETATYELNTTKEIPANIAPLLTMLEQRTRQVASTSLNDYESFSADTGGANYIRRYIVMVDIYFGDNVEQKRMALK
jgi:hypothetical protein